MSLELIDARLKMTHETNAVLEALSRTSGRDRSELMRDVLHDWALNKIHEANVLAGLLKSQGLTGIEGGVSGNRRDSQGVDSLNTKKGAR